MTQVDLKYSVHIPKTAGTFARDLLFQFPADAVYFYYNNHNNAGLRLSRIPVNKMCRDDEWFNRIQKGSIDGSPVIRSVIIHGHYLAKQFLTPDNRGSFLTWVREPVERILSHYYFWKANAFPGDPEWRRMKEHNWTIEEFASQDYHKNTQFMYLDDLKLEEMLFVGVVESMEKSLSVASEIFQAAIRPIKKRNANPEKQTERYDVSSELRRFIERENMKDVELYELAVQRLSRS